MSNMIRTPDHILVCKYDIESCSEVSKKLWNEKFQVQKINNGSNRQEIRK